MGGPLFWLAVYAGVLASALLRRWRQSRAQFDLGDAGWRQDIAQEYPSQLSCGFYLARRAVDLGRYSIELCREAVRVAEDFLDALTF